MTSKVTVEKVIRPEYEGGGVAYQVFIYAIRNGNQIRNGVARSGIYSDMVKMATADAKRLKFPLEICAK